MPDQLLNIDEITAHVVDAAVKIHRQPRPGLLESVYEIVLCGVLERRGLKSVEKLSSLFSKQLLTYLRLMNLPVGLSINFGGETLKEGLRRIVNDYRDTGGSRLPVIER